MPPAVAIAVVSWNTRTLLDACLGSMRADAEAGRAEVWVVDNGSIDGSPELVADQHRWARLLRAEENLGFGRAVNWVAAQTDAPWIAAANADIALTPSALARLLDAGDRDPRAGAIAPRLLLPDGSTQRSVQEFPTLGESVLSALDRHRNGARHRDLDRPARVPWATGAFLLLRRMAFEQAGRFDERQWLYAEDLDLCWRLRRAGWGVLYEPSAHVRHEENAATATALGADFDKTWLRATYAWQAKVQGVRRTWATALVELAAHLPRLWVLRLLARRSPERFGHRAVAARRAVVAARFGLRTPADLLRPPSHPVEGRTR